ncbi:3'(2'),5'-bisphosphate nucleotidase CysQ [Kineosporia sp. J2-2]|uniref:3'(2'),5-bisphosphonucleoside 3'(2')-phosphohydrolase n=1 Tax=Kineosporia corallincola TaxID=2835133 RepID=A0ABS5THI5_9ACTN|nr:3'(2'),5'-bisphosphate nucleotidase CysQ [Kineosporia corallincola]MBT0770553.1 3'(2'),5'-bisphosphate nucleotidase CysQ [Kineosporia corallincola]
MTIEPGGDDARLARTLAHAAGLALLEVRTGSAEGKELKDAGDARAQEVLAKLLAEYRPDDAVLSEEAADSAARLSAERVWIIDPLDGTREFSERPRSDWAVHVALWQRGREYGGRLTDGAIALPARDITYGTDDPPVLPPRPDGPIRLAVSRSRPPAFVTQVAEELGAELVPMGSAGVKCSSVWTNEADAYLHAGGQFEWDSAAPVAVAQSVGLHTSRIDGSPLIYNRVSPKLPDLLVCRTEFAEKILATVARHIPEVITR